MRVSTAGMNTQMISQAMRVQSEYANALSQKASGQKSESLSGLAGQAGAATSLTSDLQRSENLATQAATTEGLVEVAYSTVENIADVVENMRVSIAAGISGSVTDSTAVQNTAKNALESIVSLLNTKYADEYIFSGTAANTKPIDISDANYNPTAGVADTHYYQGSDCLSCVMVNGDNAIDYSVSAGESAFEETLRSLSTLVNMDPTLTNTATLQSAMDLLDDATTGLGLIQEKLSSQANTLTDLAEAQKTFQTYATEALKTITAVDIGEATANVSQKEVSLQASYATLSSLSKISLLDYL